MPLKFQIYEELMIALKRANKKAEDMRFIKTERGLISGVAFAQIAETQYETMTSAPMINPTLEVVGTNWVLRRKIINFGSEKAPIILESWVCEELNVTPSVPETNAPISDVFTDAFRAGG